MRSPSPSRARADRPLRMTAMPSPRVLNFLSRLSPLKAKGTAPLSQNYAHVPASPTVSIASSSSAASWRRSRRKSGTLSPRYAPEHDITALTTSLNPMDSIRVLRHRKWRLLDASYVVLVGLILFSAWVAPSAPLIKTLLLVAFSALLLVPVSGQFFFAGLPIWTYLIYFFCSRFIPIEWRPAIWVKLLPTLENVIFGTSISHVLSEYTHPILDLLAWLPYGIGHFAMPAICSFAFFFFAAPGTMPSYARAFGWMSVLGVTIAIVFPTAPPWYEVLHPNLEPAQYGMGGSPAGLARIDALFGFDMYTTTFTTNPLPFGAFPSLHGGNALLQALFVNHAFPRLRWFAFGYVAWIWWATMYLGHHYAVDLLGGGAIAISFFAVYNRFWLPRAQTDKLTRWDYEYVEIGSRRVVDDIESRPTALLGLKELQRSKGSSEDSTWSISGSTSSFYSRSGSSVSSGSSSGSRSPSLSEDEGVYNENSLMV
jgi:membrane-associated phospholipid phosphatase